MPKKKRQSARILDITSSKPMGKPDGVLIEHLFPTSVSQTPDITANEKRWSDPQTLGQFANTRDKIIVLETRFEYIEKSISELKAYVDKQLNSINEDKRHSIDRVISIIGILFSIIAIIVAIYFGIQSQGKLPTHQELVQFQESK